MCSKSGERVKRVIFLTFYAVYKDQSAKMAIYERPFATFYCALFTSPLYRRENESI